ncbi:MULTISPECIES: hypothetical protein [Acinetobacter]|jgi:hypothetical protein|uniref:Uncharacterized protein n=2 Tax=Acinetobacter baumannii TaxID=470 RepID=A0A090BEM5_ACIBA|nr:MULTISPECIES: hypothetical protein [Acinetobacter]AKQ32619.1 hypothetical protein ACX61_19715 [Acinetobacter baumannii]ALG88287.1 hypothetical protein [Acinetobacter baumannii]AMQ95697.1 hypothetical protein [Acinetobacter baumannii]ASS85436.1 hypothetical protein [Acinetobacter baumannii]EHU1275422.1 hypothetical protein [Acinetobacter baumannii]
MSNSSESKNDFQNGQVENYLAKVYPDLPPKDIGYMAATMAATIEAEARFMRKWKSDAPTAEEFKRRIPFLEYLFELPEGSRPPRGKCRKM